MTGEKLGREGCERLADAAFDARSAGSQVEVVVEHLVEGLTRFAGSQVHQNVARDDIAVTVRVVTSEGRQGVVTVHTDDPPDVAEAAHQAAALAAVAPADHDHPGLAPGQEPPEAAVDEATAAATPADRAAAVAALLSEVPGHLDAAGAYRTTGAELGVFTTAGQRAFTPMSAASVTVVVAGATSSGYAEGGGRAIADIDAAQTGRTAVTKAVAGTDPQELSAGVWPVILEPPAVATMMQWLAYLGFGARDWLEGRAFTAGRLGERFTDPSITLVDDALAPTSAGQTFDHEGTPKQRVELLRAGVATQVVHDRATAAKVGVASTGHALRAPNTVGPMAVNPVLQPGDGGDIEQLVSQRERALLVTRFHYTNVVNPKDTTITGMTRDGTFLVEDGRITRAVRNLRFTQPILGALTQVDAVSTQTAYASEIFHEGAQFPALALPAFSFSGTTTFG